MNISSVLDPDFKKGRLYLADCFNLLDKWFHYGLHEFIDLVYIDPPFNSKRDYNVIFKSELAEKAFADTWSDISYLDEMNIIHDMNPGLFQFLQLLEKTEFPKSYISYLVSMAIRCWLIHKALKPTGSFYYHCDPTMSHYVKIMLDYIFGVQNYRNEIIWRYRRWTNTSSSYKRMHDSILFYTKTDDYTFNEIRMPAVGSQADVVTRGYNVNKVVHKGEKVLQLLVYNKKKVDRLIDAGKLDLSKYGNIIFKDGLTEINDVWDIPILHSQAKERLGYPTQKPEALLERIITASSNEGDVVADFYGGGGTTIAVAQKLGRRYIYTDLNYRALQITKDRLENLGLEVKKDFLIFGLPESSAELRSLVESGDLGKEKNSRFEFEDVIVKYYMKGVAGNEKKVGDGSIDGRFPFKFEGNNHIGIVQVTVGSNINHFKAFCSEVDKGTGLIGVYVAFEDKITSGMYRIAKEYGKIGNVDRVQILTVEDLIDRGKQFDLPADSPIFS